MEDPPYEEPKGDRMFQELLVLHEGTLFWSRLWNSGELWYRRAWNTMRFTGTVRHILFLLVEFRVF